jgi:hypothetical protein
VKDPTDTKTRIGTVYKVTCAECPATYIGETGRTLDCRIKEHKRSTEKQDVANRIAVHHIETNHRIDWEGATCMEFNGFEDERMFLESFNAAHGWKPPLKDPKSLDVEVHHDAVMLSGSDLFNNRER